MVQRIKNLFKKKEVAATDESKYYLVFMDMTPAVQFIERDTLADIYEIIVASQLKVGTYKIIKGVFLND